jgi:hypothetical protein
MDRKIALDKPGNPDNVVSGHAPLARKAIVFGWAAVNLLAWSAVWPGSAEACLILIEEAITGISAERVVSPIGPCGDNPVALIGANTNRVQDGPARPDPARRGNVSQHRASTNRARDGSVRPDRVLEHDAEYYDAVRPQGDVAHIGIEAAAIQTLRDLLGPEAVRAIRDLYKSIRPDAAAAAPERRPADRDGADSVDDDVAAAERDRDMANRIYRDVADIEGRFDAARLAADVARGLRATEDDKAISVDGNVGDNGFGPLAPEAVNLYNAIRLDSAVATPALGAANRHIAISLDGDVADVVFRTGAIQTTNLLGPIHLDSPASRPGAISYYNPADAALQADATATSSSERTGGGRQHERDIRIDLLAMLLTFLYSSEGVALSVIILFVYVAFRGVRKLIGAWRSAESSRPGAAPSQSGSGKSESPRKAATTRRRSRRTPKRLRPQE